MVIAFTLCTTQVVELGQCFSFCLPQVGAGLHTRETVAAHLRHCLLYQAVFTYRYTFLHNFVGKLGLKVTYWCLRAVAHVLLAVTCSYLRARHSTKRNHFQVVHLVWHTIAMGFMLFGLYATIEWHRLKNQPELYSLHSWLGVRPPSFHVSASPLS